MLENLNHELLWFLLGLAFLLSEFVVPGFVIAFFGVGAWVTAILTGVGLTVGGRFFDQRFRLRNC